MSQPDPAPELDALADELRRLAPTPPGLDRDALLFRAGRASAGRGWLWPAATAVSSLTAAALGAALLLQPPPQTVVETIRVRVEAPAPSAPPGVEPYPVAAEAPAPDDRPPHLRLQEHLLRWGLDGLGEPPQSEPPPRPSADLFSHYSDLLKGETLR
jgi:hypothetical protein